MAYRLLPDGGFVCGDSATGLTAYAYPCSAHAEAARRAPLATAQAMLAGEQRAFRVFESVREFDDLNWLRLEG